MADHLAVAGWWRDDVETFSGGRRCCGHAGAVCRAQQESAGSDREIFPIIMIQGAGLDGFWIRRVLRAEGVKIHVVDPVSIATPRWRRRAKTDKIDGEALLRTLLAYKRGEPRFGRLVSSRIWLLPASMAAFHASWTNSPERNCSSLTTLQPIP
jgi:hypothetical protein